MTQLTIHVAPPPATVRAVLRQKQAGAVATAFAGAREGSFAPAFEVREYTNHFTIQADVPGVKSTDLEIFIHDDWLAVLGKRPPEEESAVSYRTYERTYGGFWRAFRFFPSISTLGVRGALRSGVLTLLIPKKRRSLAC